MPITEMSPSADPGDLVLPPITAALLAQEAAEAALLAAETARDDTLDYLNAAAGAGTFVPAPEAVRRAGTDNAMGISPLGLADVLGMLFAETKAALRAIDTTSYDTALFDGYVWRYNSSDLSATLLDRAATSTGVAGNVYTVSGGHTFKTGDPVTPTASANGVTAGTTYWVIRLTSTTFSVATTYANAWAETAAVLSGTTNQTFNKHADPEEGIYVIPTGDAADGSDGAWVRDFHGVVEAAWFGASASATAEENAVALQAWGDYLFRFGGAGAADGETYSVARPLDFRNYVSDRREIHKQIDWRGATLDFSASGLTDGDLVTIGAIDLSSASELQDHQFSNLTITGPEDGDDIIPETAYRDTNLSGGTATAISSCVGFACRYVLGWSPSYVRIEKCHTGAKYLWCWEYVSTKVFAEKCIIGHYVEEASTDITLIKPSSVFCTWGLVVSPTGTVVVGSVNIFNARFENCTVAGHFDPGETGAEIQGIHFSGNTYLENIYYDHFRLGIAFSPNPANASSVGANRAGKITSFVFDGARCSGDGVTTGWSTNRKAFRFATQENVASGYIRFPCSLADIAGAGNLVNFEGQLRAEDVGTQEIHTVRVGEGHAQVAGDGTVSWMEGCIFSCAKQATGRYDLTLDRGLASLDKVAVQVSVDSTAAEASWDRANSTTSVLRICTNGSGGSATDLRFCVSIKGVLAPL